MKRLLLALTALLTFGALAVVAPVVAQVSAVPQLMNFQGRLAKPDGTPIADGERTLTFKLFSVASGGSALWSHTMPVTVRNGVFSVLLGGSTGTKSGPLTSALFTADRWVEIQVGNDPPQTPRQPIASIAYAMKADSVKDGSITTSSLANNAVTGAKIADGTITGADIANGTITANKFGTGIFNPIAWLLNGNAGTNGTQFLGTTDASPLEFRANAHRMMRYSYAENATYRGINILGGSELNTITDGFVGATLAGGGGSRVVGGQEYPNRVVADYGTVGGGASNTAGEFATVGGGASNTASGILSTVAGGDGNRASYWWTTVAGGASNLASGNVATVAGGALNTASGGWSTAIGGYANTASGESSFAAGNRAKALHSGSFVWADNQGADFASTGSRQFLIRAAGGVGINISNPGGYTFAVNGSIRTNTLVVGGNQTIDGTLAIGTVPFGDYRNLQINGNTGVLYYDNSSRKHKRNITPLVDDFEKLLKAVPMTYTRPAAPNRWEIGFIAEDFDALGLKRLVDYSDKGEVEGINYEKICLYLTAIASKQNDRLHSLQQQNQSDRSEIAALKAEVAELKALMQQLVKQQK